MNDLYSFEFCYDNPKTGKTVYPVRQPQKSESGKPLFRVQQGVKEGPYEPVEEAVMVHRVLEEGWKVRMAPLDDHSHPSGIRYNSRFRRNCKPE